MWSIAILITSSLDIEASDVDISVGWMDNAEAKESGKGIISKVVEAGDDVFRALGDWLPQLNGIALLWKIMTFRITGAFPYFIAMILHALTVMTAIGLMGLVAGS